MLAHEGPERGRISSANDIVHNRALVGEVLSDDIATTHRLPAPNSSLRRAEKEELEGLVRVSVRLDAHDLGALLFKGATEGRMESVLTEAELGAVVLANIVEDALDIKTGFDVAPAGEFANLSVRLHHHLFTDEQLEDPEFLISREGKDHVQKGYVEFRWSAHAPMENHAEHAVPVTLVNALVQVLKQNGYERHWKTAIARFHPEWDRDRDDNYLERTTGEDGSMNLSVFTTAAPAVLDLSDLRSALRRELDLNLKDLRRGLHAYTETDTQIRIRIRLSAAAESKPHFGDILAEEIDRELGAHVLDGNHITELSEGGVPHVVLQYSFETVGGTEANRLERAAAHRAIFSVISSHRKHFA